MAQRILVAVCNWCISTLTTALRLHCLDPGNPSIHVQWNLDMTHYGQRTDKICSLLRGFVISRFFFIYFTIIGVTKIVPVIPRTSLYAYILNCYLPKGAFQEQ